MINTEKIIRLAEQNGAIIQYNSKVSGIGCADLDGIFKSYISLKARKEQA